MDIRKYIIILCLFCCHAIGAKVDKKTILYYRSISDSQAKEFFKITDRSAKVTYAAFGQYQYKGIHGFVNYKWRKFSAFAVKMKCAKPCVFSYKMFIEGSNYKQFYMKNTLIVDGQAKVLTTIKVNKLSDEISYELPAGEHEIVIMNAPVDDEPIIHCVSIRETRFHTHSIFTADHKSAFCGQDGYIKRKCKLCTYQEVDTLSMPEEKHKFDREYASQGSCMIPHSLFRKCINCGLTEFNIRRQETKTHNFQNGRCVNDSCELKLPVKNAAGIYQVGDAYELRGLAEQIAAGDIPRDCNIDLKTDIIYPEGLAHLPIGTTDYPFAGTFDGHGHRIGNMQSAVPANMTGLFGVVKGTPGRLAVIANVIIDASSKLKGKYLTGAIAGWADYCDIVRCVSRATIIGYRYVGGIVGYSERECHVIDCASLGTIDSKRNGGLLSGILRRGYIMDSYGSGSFADKGAEPALALTADSPLRHCFQLDAKAPMTGVTSFSSAQLSDGTLVRMLCEKNGKGMPAHWQQGAKDGCPVPVFTALTDRPASDIQPQGARAGMPASAVNSYFDEEDEEEDFDEEDWEEDWDEDEEWCSFSPESEPGEETIFEDFVFYDEADSTLSDYACYVTTTYRNVPAMPMFSPMQGGDATMCDVTYCKRDSSVIMEYNYAIDGRRNILTDAIKQYMTPDSVVHVERYEVEGNEHDGEFLMTNNRVYFPDDSGYEENVLHGVATKVEDWEISQFEGTEPTLNYYFYDENGQERVEVYSIPLSDKDSDDEDEEDEEYDGEAILLPIDMDYTKDENGRLMDLHYVFTDSITGEQYNIGGQYYIYDEQGELLQAVSYEPVAFHSCEMRQTEYTTFESYNADVPSSIIPIEQLQPGSLDGSSTRTSTHVYDLRGNLVRLSNDAAALKSLPKGIYITRGRKIMVY